MRCSPVFPAIVLASCALACGGPSRSAPAPAAPAPAPAPAPTQAASASPPAAAATPAAPDANSALDALFAEYDAGVLARSPIAQSERGIKTDHGKWDDFSDEQAARNNQADAEALAAMRTRFGSAALDDAHRLSYRLFEDRIERQARSYRFRSHGYVFDQMNGAQSRLTAFLINIHKVSTAGDAEAYVQRLQGMGPALRQLLAVSASRAAQGFLPPRWVYPYVVSDARNVLKGAPFDGGPDSALLADFKAKLAPLKLSPDETHRLTAAASAALVESVKPAYEAIIAAMTEQAGRASTDDGVWRFPDGADYYATLLRNYTTTELSADQIHELGLQQVARIHQEMAALMPALHIRGTLPQLLVAMRDRKDLVLSERARRPRDVPRRDPEGAGRGHRQAAAVVRHAAPGAARGQAGRGVPREVGRQGVLSASGTRWLSPRHLLRQPL